ncbi:unnamed protein product [Moneuplotes crassus]|uniref:Uncharacterized protein n=1 Tax=Euplotes crassus TaxID=5936 RepID=A0AAD1XC71_EUPCR|nr:unnamed protein product [Moneuplotes crassus]
MQSIEKKRQRVSEDPDSSSKPRLSGKERAKIHRERKKKYYEDLEADNEKFKIEIKDLKEEILKQATEIKQLEEKLKQAEEASASADAKKIIKLPQLSSFFNINKEEEKQNPAEKEDLDKSPCESKEGKEEPNETGVFTADPKRMELMKQHLSEIIENIIPPENKLMLVLFEYVPVSKFIRMKNLSRYKYLDRKSVGIPLLDEFIESYLSDSLIDFIEAYGKRYLKTLQEVRRVVKKLVYIKSKLSQTLTSLYDIDKEVATSPEAPFESQDYLNILTHCSKMKESDVFSNKILWHLDQTGQDEEVHGLNESNS